MVTNNGIIIRSLFAQNTSTEQYVGDILCSLCGNSIDNCTCNIPMACARSCCHQSYDCDWGSCPCGCEYGGDTDYFWNYFNHWDDWDDGNSNSYTIPEVVCIGYYPSSYYNFLWPWYSNYWNHWANYWDDGTSIAPGGGSTTPTPTPTPAYSINDAVNAINENAHNSSQGECSRYVHNAIVAGGIEAAKNQPVQRGGAYGPLLQEWGFTMVTTTLVGYTPINGDIAVIQGYPGGTTCNSCDCPCGHIQMYNGDQWVSDFFQPTHRTFYPGPGYEENAPSFEIYRWE